jgi:hypothetical protein
LREGPGIELNRRSDVDEGDILTKDCLHIQRVSHIVCVNL